MRVLGTTRHSPAPAGSQTQGALKAAEDDANVSGGYPDYVARNKVAWERWAPRYVAAGRELWAADDLRWGIWGIRETELLLLEGLPPGADVVELGCGTASTSAWLARRGFYPVGVDIALPLLEAGARFEDEFGVRFPLVHANAEHLQYDGESFDCVISDYGASLWCNPRRWIAEAARLLRPGGRLIFATSSAQLMTCTPEAGGIAGTELVREYFGRYRVEFEADGAVEFHLTHGRWIRLLRGNGLVLENLVETRPPPDATSRFDFATVEWAQRWPSEEIWIASKPV
jgi:SAM-dependent methyltransferase